MRKIITILLLALGINADAQWVEKNTNFSDAYRSIVAINSDTVFVRYNTNIILRSYNSGVDWDTTHLSDMWVREMRFINDSVGFIYGLTFSDTIPSFYKTVNYGNVWEAINFSANTNSYHLPSMCFVSNNTGFLGNGSIICKTIDGGISLDTVVSLTTDSLPINWISDIRFVNENTGFYIEVFREDWGDYRNMIYKTTNQGLDWIKVYDSVTSYISDFGFKHPDLKKIYFSDSQHGYFLGIPGIAIYTEDAGVSWSTLSIPNVLADLDFVTVDTGFVLGENGLYRTTDKGFNWQKVAVPDNPLPIVVDFVNSNLGYVAGAKLHKTESGTNPLSISNYNLKSQFKIYPNPTNDKINIDYPNEVKIQNIQLVDITGKLVKSFCKNEKVLNVNDISSGMYFLNIQTKEGNVSEKIIVK